MLGDEAGYAQDRGIPEEDFRKRFADDGLDPIPRQSLWGVLTRRSAAEARGLDEVFRKAGFEWRGAGCSMCLAMNPDKLEGRQMCASSSNRNFKGRQGSPTGRTLLMSPAMVAAAAVSGEVVDVRPMLEEVHA